MYKHYAVVVCMEVLKFAIPQPICHCVNKMLVQSAHMSISHMAVTKTFEMHSLRVYCVGNVFTLCVFSDTAIHNTCDAI